MPVQNDGPRFVRRRSVPGTFAGQFGFGCTHPSRERRHSASHAAQSSSTRTPRTIAACGRVGAARGSSRGSPQSEPSHRLRAVYDTPPYARNIETRGRPPRFDSASRSSVTASEAHTDSNHSTTMARSLGSSMARGLGILLIMMTLSEIAATRARPAYHNKGLLPPPIETAPRAPPPLQNARRSSSAGRGDPGNERGQRRRGDSRDAPPNLARNAQAPSSTRTTGPFILSRPAFVRSSRPLGLAPMMWPMPTRRPSVPRPLR